MKRIGWVLPLILVALGWNLAFGAAAYLQHIPRIANGAQAATICDGKAPLFDQDTGSLSAIRDADGRYIVAAQLRSDGSRAHIMQHIGASLSEIAAPPGLASFAPSFTPTGVKHGSLALVPSATPGGRSRLYYTRRTPENEALNSGPYGVWCTEF